MPKPRSCSLKALFNLQTGHFLYPSPTTISCRFGFTALPGESLRHYVLVSRCGRLMRVGYAATPAPLEIVDLWLIDAAGLAD